MIISNGKTDVTTYFVLRDSTNHAPKTDVTITDIDLYYVEEGAAISAKADATALAAADSAHGDNQAYHVGQGMYRIDWPDAAFDGGIGKKVQLIVVCTGVDTTFLEVELSPAANVKAISDDSTAADNAESFFDGTGYAGTNNVIPTVTTLTGHTAQTGDCFARLGAPAGASVSADIAAVKSDSGAIKAKTDNLPADPADDSDIDAQLATITGYLDTEIAAILAAVDTEVAAIKAKTDNLPASPAASGDIPSAATIADAVWDEAIAGHLAAGSTGNALNAAGSAGDPWSTPLPGAYGAGTAGKIIGDNINAPIGTVDTVVDAIKAKTDNLPADPADQSAVEAAITAATSPLATAVALDAVDNYIDTEIAAIKAKTDNLPASPANEATLTTIASYIDTEVAAIKAKTDNLPADPADQSAVEAAITAATSPLATAAALSTVSGKIDTVDTVADAIKAKTDSLTFTVAGQVDSNVQSVNDTALTGNGSTGTPWGPA